MTGPSVRFTHALVLCVSSLALVCGWCGEMSKPAPCELVLALPKAEWLPNEKVVATLILRNKGSSTVTVVESWLPSGSEITRKYVQDGQSQESTLLGGTLRGVTGEHYSAARRPEEYVAVPPGDSLKSEVDLTSRLRNGQEWIPEGDYRVVLRYSYERSKEEAGMSLFDGQLESNPVQLRVSRRASTSDLDPDRVALLLQRIDTYQMLTKNREYDRSYELLSQWWAEPPEDRKEWVRAGRKMDNGIRITDWKVTEVRIAGDRARVLTQVLGQTREGVFRWKNFAESQTAFWILERTNWYFIPMQVPDWDDTQAVQVPLPTPQSKVIIKEKQP